MPEDLTKEELAGLKLRPIPGGVSESMLKIFASIEPTSDNDRVLHDMSIELLRRREAERWIPVTERMPEPQAWDSEKRFFAWDGLCQWLTEYTADRQFRDDEHGDITKQVTHWMPLPPPPEETRSE